MDLLPLLLLAPALVLANPGVSLHISFQSLQQLDALASSKIESLDDATSYVRQSAALCGAADPAFLPEGLESRLARAEWDTEREPSKLVSDDQVASAFNFISGVLGVQHPQRLTASDVLQYRTAMAAIFPHVFSPKSLNGSRPVGSMVMLYLLVYNGGMTDGARKVAQLDRPPGSLKVDSSRGGWTPNRNLNLIAREYQTAGVTYFQRQSTQEVRAFAGELAKIVGLPGEKP